MRRFYCFAAPALFGTLAACSSSSPSSPPAPPPPAPTTSTLNGGVLDGPVSGGTVDAYEVTASGTLGTLVGGPATTAADGSYSLTLSAAALGTYDGPILLQVTGGTYTDDVTGQTVNLTTAKLSLSALIPPPSGGWIATGISTTLSTSITPLSTLAASVGLGLIADGNSAGTAATIANTANTDIGNYFGGLTDLLTTTVLDLTQAGCAASATQSSIDASIVIAAIDELAAANGVSGPNLLMALIQDVVADGKFDGTANGIAIEVPLIAGNTLQLKTIEGPSGLAAALQVAAGKFLASKANACDVTESAALTTALSSNPSPQISAPATTYTVAGSASGLPDSGSVVVAFDLMLASGITASGDTDFQYTVSAGEATFNGSFPTLYAAADVKGWSQAVVTSPAGYTCTVTPGNGSFTSPAVTGVALSCSAAPPPTYTVGGNVSGLPASTSVVLQDNGSNALTVTANGPFTFPTPLVSGSAYLVSVQTQPSGANCTVSAGSGTVSGNVNTVAVTCTANASTASLNAPRGLAFYANQLYVANTGGNQVLVFSETTNSSHAVTMLTQIGSITTGISGPEGLAFDTGGNLYVTNTAGNAVTVYSTANGVYTLLTTISGLSSPVGIAVDSNGNVYVGNTGSTAVSPFGSVEVFTANTPGSPAGGFSTATNSNYAFDATADPLMPPGVLFDANVGVLTGNVVAGEYLLDGTDSASAQNQVLLFGSSSPTFPLLAPGNQSGYSGTVPAYILGATNNGVAICQNTPQGPSGIAAYASTSPEYAAVYITGFTSDVLYAYVLTQLTAPTGCPTPVRNSVDLNGPQGVAVDVYGNVFVTNANASSVTGATANSIVIFPGGPAFSATTTPEYVFTQ